MLFAGVLPAREARQAKLAWQAKPALRVEPA